jgi:putative phosphoribosyl transferase
MTELVVRIPAAGVELPGDLVVPSGSVGVVVFAHGSGSSRGSPRNRRVAGVLHSQGLATLLFDLLTDEEALDRRNVFDIALLGERLDRARTWLAGEEGLAELPVGYFGASTGAAAALWAAASPGRDIGAVVSRGGRPDLAGDRLGLVGAPTLLIVGSLDQMVLEMNRQAQRAMRCPTQLVVVPGAGHLFEEPGALDEVAGRAAGWFRHHLPGESGELAEGAE